jgi:hypothetical protein
MKEQKARAKKDAGLFIPIPFHSSSRVLYAVTRITVFYTVYICYVYEHAKHQSVATSEQIRETESFSVRPPSHEAGFFFLEPRFNA